RVAVFNKYYNGTTFVEQSPAVTGLADVGTKDANALGIFDMSGNAMEWCWDRYSATVATGSVTDPQSASSSSTTRRVLRGGNWTDNPHNETAVYDCMTGKREDGSPSEDNKVIGFRLVWKE
ncbi:formylglycine-generating enzyme family protein, partial [Treponema lecithinolyticum]